MLGARVVLVVCALGTVTLLDGCDKAPDRPKRAQMVKLLPDTPPPPPPKLEEKKPEPPKEEKPQPQLTPPKPQDAPQPQALKTDEQPGTGDGSGLQAGEVNQDYVDQRIGGALIGGTSGQEVGGNRLAFSAFAGAVTRALNEFLARDRDLKRLDYRIHVNVWLQANGALQRAELVGSTGDPTTDDALRAALKRFPGVSQSTPEKLPQPIRLLISNRMIG